MDLSVSEKDREIIKLLIKDLIIIKQQLQEYLIALGIGIGEEVVTIITSYREYSLSNIKSKGIKEIIFQRALRFFKMQEQYKKSKSKSRNHNKNNKYKNGKLLLKRSIKFILLPIYLLVLVLIQLKKKNLRKNLKKNVINKYEY